MYSIWQPFDNAQFESMHFQHTCWNEKEELQVLTNSFTTLSRLQAHALVNSVALIRRYKHMLSQTNKFTRPFKSAIFFYKRDYTV